MSQETPHTDRRRFLVGVTASLGAIAFGVRSLPAQQAQPQQQQNFAPMEQGAYLPTIRPAKAGATPLLSIEQRDALEHKIKCQCGCILDIYTCRTTDFTCQVSPAMHRDVLRLVEGGYSGDEILAAFVETYGEVALTAPVKQGFNWAGYFVPSVAMATGALVLTLLLRKRGRQARVAAPPSAAAPLASADELAKLERALREER